MYLSKEQSNKFYRLYYSLISYTNERYHVVDDLFEPGSLHPSPEKLNAVAAALWADARIIDGFVRENPAELDFDEIRIVREWKHHVDGYFFIAAHREHYTVLLQDDYAFGVIGITHDIDELFEQIPVGAETTLLPFEGHIVYDMAFRTMPIVLGPNITKKIKDDLRGFERRKAVISDAKALVNAAKEIADAARRAERDGTAPARDLFSEAKTGEMTQDAFGTTAGIHVGALSGLPEEEREKKLEEYYARDENKFQGILFHSLEEIAIHKTPADSLAACLALLKKDDLADIARMVGTRQGSVARKADIVSELAKNIPDSGYVPWRLERMDIRPLLNFEKAVNAGGRLRVSTDDMVSIVPILLIQAPLVFLFRLGNEYEVVVPKEIQEIFRKDRERILKQARTLSAAILYADAFVKLYGIVSLDDFLNVFNEHHEEQLDAVTLYELLSDGTLFERGEYSLWNDEGVDYVLNCQLDCATDFGEDDLDDEFDENGPAEDGFENWEFDGDDLEDEEYDEDEEIEWEDYAYARYLVERHRKIPMKPISQDELLRAAGLGYFETFPEIVKLRMFLDANVPDDMDDFTFAENIVEELTERFLCDESMSEVIQYLVDSGLEFDIDKMNAMIAFVVNAANSMPKWANNGWTPHELIEKQMKMKGGMSTGEKTKKTGRNDPCPCGSGKKYKNCCAAALN